MIKQAYFRGLMKAAKETPKPVITWERDPRTRNANLKVDGGNPYLTANVAVPEDIADKAESVAGDVGAIIEGKKPVSFSVGGVDITAQFKQGGARRAATKYVPQGWRDRLNRAARKLFGWGW